MRQGGSENMFAVSLREYVKDRLAVFRDPGISWAGGCDLES